MKELLGEENVYPFVSFGLYQVKSAWKLFSRMNNVAPAIANDISKAIEEYDKAIKYADEDEKENIYPEDFIPHKYINLFNESKEMRSVIDSVKKHACGYICSPVNVRENIGVITVGKDREPVAAIEGVLADKLGYIKNDILVVSIVDILDKIYKKIGIQQHSPAELLELCDNNQPVWDIYSSGTTFEVNQMGAPRTINFLKQFVPKNIYDLSATVAVIRPGAMSVINRIRDREHYTYNIEEIDKLLSEHVGSESPAILYQESIMAILSLAGFSVGEAYNILKLISKKKEDLIKEKEEPFKIGMAKRYSISEEHTAIKSLWTQIVDAGRYAFNVPHSLATALDSLYMAYLKVTYPVETYTTLLEYYSLGKKRDVGKVSGCKKELEKIGEKVLPISIGQDNTHFSKSPQGYTQSMLALKGANEYLAEALRDIDPTQPLISIYEQIKSIKSEETDRSPINRKHWRILCKINYFPTNNKKAEILVPYLYDKVYTKKQFRQTSLDKIYEELGVRFSIDDYCNRKTAKTYYLHPDKKMELCQYIYDMVNIPAYTEREAIQNEIEVYGFLSDAIEYLKLGYIVGQIKQVGHKNSSVKVELPNEKVVDIGITGDINLIKKDMNIICLDYSKKIIGNKLFINTNNYVVY